MPIAASMQSALIGRSLRALLPKLFEACSIVAGWLMIAMLWLSLPLFLLASGVTFLIHVETRPIWAIGNLTAGMLIASLLFWGSWKLAKSLHWPNST